MQTKSSSHGGTNLADAVRKVYEEGQTDYSIEPLVRVDEIGQPLGLIRAGDGVIFCCRRGEREIELTEAFTDPAFPHFARPKLDPLTFVILTLYHEKFKDLPVAFLPSKISSTLGEVVSRAGLSQLRCSESEKFAHITFFLNGGNNQPFAGETDIRLPSPKGVPFDQVPELCLPAVADKVIKSLSEGYNLIVTNFANGDVIGHTANARAKVACAEAVDTHLGRVLQAASEKGYVTLITADHGNLEELLTSEGKPHVSHTTNLVPLFLIDTQKPTPLEPRNGKLADIAPTILRALGVEKPPEMTGIDLIPDHDWSDRQRVLLVILDGWGIGQSDDSNPIYLAHTPVWDDLNRKLHPAKLHASGEMVGLQEGKAGNSEAGHMNIGAGRVVPQDDVRLDNAMNDGSFYTNEVFLQTIDHARINGTSLHLIALLTEKSSHGSIDYPLALLKMAKERGLESVFIHVIFDGRSTPPGSAPALLEKLENLVAEIGIGQVVSGIGRGIALDRDGNYAKIEKAYKALVEGVGKAYC